MPEPELVPVRIGGYVVAYRPATKKTSAKKAAEKKAAASSATKAQEAK